MAKYGLLGYPLGHSFSKKYFQGRLDYDNFEFPTPGQLLDNRPKDLKGFSVTIPHKLAVIPFLNSLSHEAEQIGAVNCVKVQCDGTLKGYNTDAHGFELSLLDLIGKNRPQALVLGSGGASRAVCYVLTTLGIEYRMVSRHGELNYENLSDELLKYSHLIINCTPLGMYPNVEQAPQINYCVLGKKHYLYDLVYNPAQTEFIRQGRKRGAAVISGLRMLELQAQKAYEIWTDEKWPY